ncbi:small subunit ribosomal protein S16 [Azospirillum fermentarium]|uniref:30S ribosomal protein S16 n=1 Tax=Azospirillum fermentarium TaxID=1233114 RepID=UPI0022265A42|nr:30S ribosomal protein S16 [Azospirillum fermentarium]MCW2248445.1 small subunit ribosomal protein S16 [Azospirillum fermentarium]
MALKIRLARGGAKKRPFYAIVVADARSPRDGRFIEKIGTYNPMLPREHEQRIVIDGERARHWLSVGAQPTDRVVLFLANLGLVEKPAIRETPKKSAPKAKAQERAKLEAQRAAAAEA